MVRALALALGEGGFCLATVQFKDDCRRVPTDVGATNEGSGLRWIHESVVLFLFFSGDSVVKAVKS